MNALFVALGILVLALMMLLLWFVPHLLQQQATRVAGETSQLREMLLDLLNEQEAVTLRQMQLGGSLSRLHNQFDGLADGIPLATNPQVGQELERVESRISEVQNQIRVWVEQRDGATARTSTQDNESWAYLMSLLSAIQERVGDLSEERATKHVATQATMMLQELEQEMGNLRGISEDIERLQWRLRRSLHERETGVSTLRAHVNGNAT